MNPFSYQISSAQDSARDTLSSARATLQSALEKLNDYIERFERAETVNKQADIINWALNHLATYIPSNISLDRFASAQAELMRADTLARATNTGAQQ